MPGTAKESAAPPGGTAGGLQAPRLVAPLPPAMAAPSRVRLLPPHGKAIGCPHAHRTRNLWSRPGFVCSGNTQPFLESSPQATGLGGEGEGGGRSSCGRHGHEGNKPGPLTPRRSDLFWRTNHPPSWNTDSWLPPKPVLTCTLSHGAPVSCSPGECWLVRPSAPCSAQEVSLKQQLSAGAAPGSLKHAAPDCLFSHGPRPLFP